jgi:hypothetical protein
MENDYLWDKKGEDKEIEQLENALKTFRYQPTAPPVLPVKILQVEEKPKFSFFNLRFALAGFACLAIMFVGLGIFLNFSDENVAVVEDLSQPIVAPIEIPNEPIIRTRSSSDLANRRTVSPFATARGSDFIDKKPIQPKYVAVSKPTRIVFQQTAPKVKPKKEIKLTAEEKFAYDQLMLALSITGEKLKEVKNKANSVEDSTDKSLR